ncbi:MAG: hypothetical protein ACRKGH_07595 [Dehalogenimonas sp.]
MPEHVSIDALLDELKIERERQVQLIRKLRHIFLELDNAGYKPLKSYYNMFSTWEHNLATIEKQIKKLE